MCNNINWSITKRNIESIITKYINFCLSLDNKSTSEITDEFLIEKLELNKESLINKYIVISEKEKLLRIEFINYVRLSFNKLTEEERKIIYWTYFDKDDNYDDSFIANNLGFCLGYYYIKKKETLIRFAYALGVESIEK